jgi:hypothetical protein
VLVLMIDTPHPVHTHSRFSLYIYKVFQHLLMWLQVIRMQPHTCNGKDYGLCVVSYYLSTNQHTTVMTVDCRGYRPLETGSNITFYI